MADAYARLVERYRYPGTQPWVMPAYEGQSIVNLVNTVLVHFGIPHGAPLADHQAMADRLRGKDKMLLLVLDGLGWANLHRAEERYPDITKRLEPAWRMPITTVFPSTTAAALSTYATGVSPASHGEIGFLMYFPEYNRVFNMLSFLSPDLQHEELTKLGFIPEEYLGHPSILKLLRDAGVHAGASNYQAYVGSGLSRMIYHDIPAAPYIAFGDLLAQALQQLRSPLRQFHYLYWSALDSIAHMHGADTDAYAIELLMIVTMLSEVLLPQMGEETALLICADHGHLDGDDADAINLMAYPELIELFRVPPAGEGRATHCFIRPGEITHAQEILATIPAMTVLTKEEFIALGLLGHTPLRVGLDLRIGDLVLLPHGSRRTLYSYQPRPHTAMVGRHGGLMPEEMVVPLLVF